MHADTQDMVRPGWACSGPEASHLPTSGGPHPGLSHLWLTKLPGSPSSVTALRVDSNTHHASKGLCLPNTKSRNTSSYYSAPLPSLQVLSLSLTPRRALPSSPSTRSRIGEIPAAVLMKGLTTHQAKDSVLALPPCTEERVPRGVTPGGAAPAPTQKPSALPLGGKGLSG